MMSSSYIKCAGDKIRLIWKWVRATIIGGDDMKKAFMDLLLSIFIGIVIPGILVSAMVSREAETAHLDDSKVSTETGADSSAAEQMRIPVIMSDGQVKNMDLDTYITGVVLAEMPAEFEEEALKAQSVVARTFTLKRLHSPDKHAQAGVCTDPACCQAYISPEDYLRREGLLENLQKVKKAVLQTSGQVLTYEGELIEATYFSCSGGKTEDAVAVWGSDIPYLKAQESPGEEHAAHYMDTVTFSKEEFLNRLGAEFTGNSVVTIENATYTEGGGVDRIDICGKEMKGTQVRQLLGLKSTAFIMTAVGDSVTVTTKGFGHRVGMSQYGADAMASKGSEYTEILNHYYPGTALRSCADVDKK